LPLRFDSATLATVSSTQNRRKLEKGTFAA
jgi:hypothetical protein